MTTDEELYFEMDFDSPKDEDQSSYKSVESLSDVSQDYHQRRGSSLGPMLERPSYLRYANSVILYT